jgi:hypothetical protein
MKKQLLLFFLLTFFIGFSQNQADYLNNFKTPNGLLDHVFDNYGNNFKLTDVAVGPKQSVIDTTKILESNFSVPQGFSKFILRKEAEWNLPIIRITPPEEM